MQIHINIMHTNRGLIGVLVLGMLVFASVQVVGADTSQSWRFLHDTYGTRAIDGTDHHYDCYMNKTGDTAVTPYSMNLPNVTEKTTWWYAEHSAECDIGFGEPDWTVYIYHGKINEKAGSDKTLWADVYKMKSDNSVVHLAGGTQTFSANDAAGMWTISCTDNLSTTQDFTTGERLAFRIKHNANTTVRIYYYNATGGKYSNLTSPSSDPGYPVPELGTLILFSTGLIVLTGYVLLTKKRKNRT